MHGFIKPFAVSTYVIHKQNYLMIRRCCDYLKGTWQMVTGGIHQGEKAWEAALREIKEETGLVPDRFYNADIVETFYMVSRDHVTFVPVFAAFVDDPIEVKLCPAEHDAHEWVTYEKFKENLVWSEQRRALTHIHENFVLKEPLSLHLIETDYVN